MPCTLRPAHESDASGLAALAATDGRGAAYLSTVYARPEVRGSGVAETLCRETVRALVVVGQAFVWLGTHVDNARANAFYERLGSTIIGERFFTSAGCRPGTGCGSPDGEDQRSYTSRRRAALTR